MGDTPSYRELAIGVGTRPAGRLSAEQENYREIAVQAVQRRPVPGQPRVQITASSAQKESTDATGLRSDVVTLYQGGLYHLYRYKKYTDVRLVFAPEHAIAFFGGDQDNFTYPRYNLDISMFRVYENDQPARVKHFLKWSPNGSNDGELVFTSGHPGGTQRLYTVAHLEYLRDTNLPTAMARMERMRAARLGYAAQGAEQARQVQSDIFAIENSLKSVRGQLAGLEDPSLLAKTKASETALRKAVDADPKAKAAYGAAWDDIAASRRAARARMTDNKNDMDCRLGKEELLSDFYHVFSQNMRDLGSPVHSVRWLRDVVVAFGDRARVGVVYIDRRPAAAGIILQARDIELRKEGAKVLDAMLRSDDTKRRTNGIYLLGQTGMPIGVEEEEVWTLETIEIKPGDVLILYTDGIPDALNQDGEFFLDKGLLETASACQNLPAHEIEETILKELQNFVGDAPQFDDITLMVLVREKDQRTNQANAEEGKNEVQGGG